MNLYEAISVRKSIRKFEKRGIEESLMEVLKRFTGELQPIFSEVPYEIVFHDAQQEKPAKKGRFCVDAPCYISFLSEDTREGQINAGFLMEQVVLFLTSRGIATCYQGNMRFSASCEGEKKELIVAAVGYPVHYLYREENTAKRIALVKQCLFKEEAGKDVLTILRAANLAPSAMNAQPWRFVVYNNRIHVMTQKETFFTQKTGCSKFLDTGIALAHMAIAAEELWLDTEWKILENIQNQNFKKYYYIISMIIQ